MKQWISTGLACLLALSIAGCGSPTGGGSSQQTLSSASNTSEAVSTPVLSKEDPWGLSLTVKDATPTGLTLVITQKGGSPTGELQYGSDYTLEVLTGNTWQEIPDIVDGNFAWDDMAYLVTMDGQTEETVNWDWLFGPLSPGHYRLSKRVMDFRDTGDYDTRDYQVEFDIP